MTAAAWWATPYHAPYWGPYAGLHAYGAPYAYGIAPPSPQQLQAMAKQHREAAMARMEARRQAMESTLDTRRPPMPEAPAFVNELNLPELPAIGERPAIPERPAFGERPPMPKMPAFGERPEIPERPAFGKRPSMPERPAMPGYDELPAMPELPLSATERQAEIDAYRAALKQQAEERRAAMQAVTEQRRSVTEQRRQDWRCARQLQQPIPYSDAARDCVPTSDKTKADSSTESNDQTADSTRASNPSS
ncbi:hypothetical protein [Lamprobacter sp.]|uniref:hypothetical protein n=1 Tax=Lamprobacter sp. TaxID=3100796 RepID=UPI002B25AB6F|nr:hypothetical protein [Lamprobacter sp.]